VLLAYVHFLEGQTMIYPFPGMNPYLENRDLWPDLHQALANAIRFALAPEVAPRYYVAVEQRTYIAANDPDSFVGRAGVTVLGPPRTIPPVNGETIADGGPVAVLTPPVEEIRERYLEIRQTGTDEVITVIEILSPTNKRPGRGRTEYDTKRMELLSTRTSLVEIDLLRGGEPLAVQPLPASHYRMLVSRGWRRPRADLYPFNLRNLFPEIPIPLRRGEDEPVLALSPLLTAIYQQARYDLRINYQTEPPPPPLSTEDAAWIDDLLHRAGLRTAG
jgi:hypothetical protein